jgi:hypothetical protein
MLFNFFWLNKKPKKNKISSASKISEKKQIIDDIRAKYGYEILTRLADEDAKISKRIEELAFEYMREVNPDDEAKLQCMGILKGNKYLNNLDEMHLFIKKNCNYSDPFFSIKPVNTRK